MKGYTNVSFEDCQAALVNWRDMYDKGGDIRDKGINLYYTKHVVNGNWWNKLNAKLDKTPEKYIRAKIPMFDTWSKVLSDVLTDDECVLLDMWSYDRHKDAYVAVKALIKASEEGKVLLDDQLCWFVNKYK